MHKLLDVFGWHRQVPSAAFVVQVEAADWYYANLRAAGFDLANVQYNNGGFMYEGNGIKGDSLSTTSSFIIGMSLAN